MNNNELYHRWIRIPFNTAIVCNKSFSEMYYLMHHNFKTLESMQIATNQTFRSYRVALQYMFVCEYTKLFEDYEPQYRKNENASSLKKLNYKCFIHAGAAFETQYQTIETKIKEIKNSDFYNHIKVLRDKKIAHSDIHKENNFEFASFAISEMDEAKSHLITAIDIINMCGSLIPMSYYMAVPNLDNSTENLIGFFASLSELN